MIMVKSLDYNVICLSNDIYTTCVDIINTKKRKKIKQEEVDFGIEKDWIIMKVKNRVYRFDIRLFDDNLGYFLS